MLEIPSLLSWPQRLAVALCLGALLAGSATPLAGGATASTSRHPVAHILAVHAAPAPVTAEPAVASAVPLNQAETLGAMQATAPTPPPTTAPPAAASPGPATASGYGCAAALAYLSAHASPLFNLECPGNALGHEAMTCINTAGICSGTAVIAIADPCPAAYMNEASNSWVLLGQSSAPIDPYGSC